MTRRLALSFEDVAALEREHERRLTRGEALVPTTEGLDPFTPCELVIHHPRGGDPLTLPATVMTAKEEQERDGQVRLMLGEGHASALSAFVAREAAPADGGGEDEPDEEQALCTDSATRSKASLPPPKRLRLLTLPEQVRLARTSRSLTERNALERLLGKFGWDALLRNQYITVPEIARIARKGTVPRPLLEDIVNNQAWARVAIIRRALLSNPKLTQEMISKVLRLAPAHELKLILKQTAYPPLVRTTAQRLMGVG